MGILYEMSTTEYEVVVQKEEQREKYSLLKVPEAGSLLVQAAV